MSAIHRFAVACLFLAIAMGVQDAVADLGGFRITRFDVEVQVESNTDLTIVERIVVDFNEPRRGIYRDIPTRYTDPSGFQYGYGFRLLGVEGENGQPRQVKQTREGPMVRLRIGSPDRRLTGTQVYVVRYRARDVLRQFEGYDELYWNVTGNRWNTTIANASVVVRFPDNIAADDMEVSAWAGRYGSTAGNVSHATTAPGEVSVRSTSALGAREGLTVAVAFPPGVVEFPGIAARVWRFISWNLIVLVPLLALIFLIRRYRKHGIDPDIPTAVMVRYEPPPGVSAGAIGTLVDEQVDLIDITATIVDLAVRGYITIRTDVEEKLFGLMKTEVSSFTIQSDADQQDLLPHEQLVLDGLFASGETTVTTDDLKEKFYAKIPAIRDALYDRLVQKKLVAGNPQTVRRKTVGMGVFAGLVTGIGGFLWATFQGAVLPNAAVLPIFSAIVTFALFAGFARAMPRRTRIGVQAVSWARGFEEFADRVEGDRFDRDAARDIFETLLPYAMALGVATKWSRKFEGVYDEQHPGWYVGPSHGMHNFSTVAFQNSLHDTMSKAGESLASSPRSSGSSGSGGGGFSGGGGGGGGGGSW